MIERGLINFLSLKRGGLFERGGLIEDLQHNSTGNACYAGYAFLAAILVSYVPREQASRILGGNAKSSISTVSRKKRELLVVVIMTPSCKWPFRKPV